MEEINVLNGRTGCLENISHKRDVFGYPRGGYKGKNTPLHRRTWQITNGDILSQDIVVMHSCDNPACVNLGHLSLGTRAENNFDRHRKGRTSTEARTNGVINGMSKLTPKQVYEIRTLAKDASVSQKKIAEMFGVSQTQVSAIHLNKFWRHLETLK